MSNNDISIDQYAKMQNSSFSGNFDEANSIKGFGADYDKVSDEPYVDGDINHVSIRDGYGDEVKSVSEVGKIKKDKTSFFRKSADENILSKLMSLLMKINPGPSPVVKQSEESKQMFMEAADAKRARRKKRNQMIHFGSTETI
jgi:hypothetical protein